jgi:2-hydroxy-3-oxopropionate reductase
VGPSGAGQIAKLANQMIVGTTIGAVAEALVFAERAGADPAKVREAIGGGFAGSRILEVHGARMIAHDFTTHGKTTSQIKDLENAERAGRTAGAPMPYTHLSLGLFRETLEQAGDVDHAGLWLTLAGRPKG